MTTYSISKDFAFSASHQLDGLPDGHPCSRLHGHNYTVRVLLAGTELDDAGMLLDYGCLAPFGRWIDTHIDHRHLNDVFEDMGNPTAENLAQWLAEAFPSLVSRPPGIKVEIGVSETPKTWAWFG